MKTKELSIDESIAMAMDCTSLDMVQYLPYVLQDFYEMGSDSENILRIVMEFNKKECAEILDLGCGKGAVLSLIAERIPSKCLGIDAVAEFIEYAQKNALDKKLNNCTFMMGDIRKLEWLNKRFDFIILGSIGPVFGSYKTALDSISPVLTEGGTVILDDAYMEEGFTHQVLFKKSEMFKQIESAGFTVIKEYIGHDKPIEEEYKNQLALIKIRCGELMEMHPEKKQLFMNYIAYQEKEYYDLENNITCSTMVLKRG